MRGQRGQTATECMGVLLWVAIIIVAIATMDVPAALSRGVHSAVCQIATACTSDGGGTRVPLHQVTPIYRGNELIARGVTIRATGSGATPLSRHVTVLNIK